MTRDAMLFLPAKVVEGLLVIACSSLYTHIFTKSAVGAFGIVNTTVQLCYLVIAGWMANAATRYVGEEYQKDRGSALFSTVSTIYLAICAAAAVFSGIAAAVTRDPIWVGGAFMFFSYTLFQILNAALIQLGRMRASIVLSLTSAACKLLIAYLIVHGSSNYPSPAPAILANTLSDGVAGIGAVIALSIPTVARLRYFSKPLLQKFFAYGVPLMGVSIAVALLNMIDRYLVTGFYGQEQFGVYNSNNSIASGIFTMISVGIMRGVYPAVLRGWREGGVNAAKPLLDQGARLYLLIATPAVAGLTAVSLPLSRFLFAAGYDAGASVIAYTALAMLFMGLTEYANKAYELEQATIHVLQNSAAAAAVKVICSLVLLKLCGFTGGALGSIIAFAFYFAITSVRVRRRFLFHVPAKSLVRIVICSLLCGAAAFACTLVPAGNLVRLVLAVCAGGLTYAVTIVVSGEGKTEFAAICSKIRR